jgi:hypothetical protein
MEVEIIVEMEKRKEEIKEQEENWKLKIEKTQKLMDKIYENEYNLLEGLDDSDFNVSKLENNNTDREIL